jgi:hypothetical protein
LHPSRRPRRARRLFPALLSRFLRPRTTSTDAAGLVYYEFEYTIEKGPPAPGPGFFRHNVSVLAARDGPGGGVLATLNAQCPEALWPRDGGLLRAAAASFRLAAAAPRRRGPM